MTELVLDICDADRAGTFGRLKSCAPLPLGLLRHVEEPDREVVLDAGLWRPGEGQGVPATPVERSWRCGHVRASGRGSGDPIVRTRRPARRGAARRPPRRVRQRWWSDGHRIRAATDRRRPHRRRLPLDRLHVRGGSDGDPGAHGDPRAVPRGRDPQPPPGQGHQPLDLVRGRARPPPRLGRGHRERPARPWCPRVARTTGRHPDQRRAGGLQRSTRCRRAATGRSGCRGGPRVDRRWSAGADLDPDHRLREDPAEDLPAELPRSARAVGRRGVLRHDVDPHDDERRVARGQRDGGDAAQPQHRADHPRPAERQRPAPPRRPVALRRRSPCSRPVRTR